MTETPEVPKSLHSQHERGRIHAQGRRTDGGSACTLLIINEADGSWTIHGLGAPGVRLTRDAMMVLAAQVLERAR